jgi:4-hydroxy-tetrahydrodipicolinate reductase
MKGHESEYSLKLNEIHHIHKLDAPSGTAISLAEDIIEVNPFYSKWTLNGEEETQLPITSERLGEVPGTHTLTYSSEVDEIKIEHIAHSRKGFALGAVIAAEWIADKKGIFSMSDVLNL